MTPILHTCVYAYIIHRYIHAHTYILWLHLSIDAYPQMDAAAPLSSDCETPASVCVFEYIIELVAFTLPPWILVFNDNEQYCYQWCDDKPKLFFFLKSRGIDGPPIAPSFGGITQIYSFSSLVLKYPRMNIPQDLTAAFRVDHVMSGPR